MTSWLTTYNTQHNTIHYKKLLINGTYFEKHIIWNLNEDMSEMCGMYCERHGMPSVELSQFK